MTNYEAVHQWVVTVKVDAALKEMEILKLKYPWLKCDKTIETLRKLDSDLPKITGIILHQEKQNAIHKEFIRVSKIADAAIVSAISEKFGYDG